MNSIDNPKETRKIITLKAAKELSASMPVANRKYPKPGYEKFLKETMGNQIYLVNSAGRLYVRIKPCWWNC